MLEEIIEEKLLSLMERHGRLYVACSGGLDSMALLDMVKKASHKLGFSALTILHVNYGLRGGESDEDASFLKAYGAKHEIPIKILDLKAEPKPSHGIQEWARQKRYSWFESLTSNVDRVAIAHSKNDIAENVLFRLARGVSENLCGMTEESGIYWRPLLGTSRNDLASYMDRHNILHREDSSNAKLDYTRNRIRHQILAVMEDIAPRSLERIAHTASDIDEILRELDHDTKEIWTRKRLSYASIKGHKSAYARRVVALFLKHQDAGIELNRNLIIDIYNALRSHSDYICELRGKNRAVVRGGVLEMQFKEAFTEYTRQYSRFLKGEPEVLLGPGARIDRNHSME